MLYPSCCIIITVNMSTKHFFHSTEGVVVLGLESLVARNSHLALDAPNKVVYSRTHSPSKVTVISGGGAGHEPCWAGMVRPCQIALTVPVKLTLERWAMACSQQPSWVRSLRLRRRSRSWLPSSTHLRTQASSCALQITLATISISVLPRRKLSEWERRSRS